MTEQDFMDALEFQHLKCLRLEDGSMLYSKWCKAR